MRIERINENKIKVLIEKQEVQDWKINKKNLGEDNPGIQDMFWTAIRKAEEDVNFSVDGAKLFVETVPDASDMLIMMITKVANDAELHDAISKSGYKGKIKQTELRLDKRPRMSGRKRERYIYKFLNFEDVCVAADEISACFAGRSALYKCGGAFYLELLPLERTAALVANILTEFAKKQDQCGALHGWLNEHGEQMIAEDAIEILNEYFCLH